MDTHKTTIGKVKKQDNNCTMLLLPWCVRDLGHGILGDANKSVQIIRWTHFDSDLRLTQTERCEDRNCPQVKIVCIYIANYYSIQSQYVLYLNAQANMPILPIIQSLFQSQAQFTRRFFAFFCVRHSLIYIAFLLFGVVLFHLLFP